MNVGFALIACSFVRPCVCSPSAIALPQDSYEQAKVLAPLFNTLVDKISRDGPWLKEVLKDVLVSLTSLVYRSGRAAP